MERLLKLRDQIDALCCTQLKSLFGPYLRDDLLHHKNAKSSNSRDRVFSLAVTFWAFLGQVLDSGSSCRKAVARVQTLFSLKGLKRPSEHTGPYCEARVRLPVRWLTRSAGVGRHERFLTEGAAGQNASKANLVQWWRYENVTQAQPTGRRLGGHQPQNNMRIMLIFAVCVAACDAMSEDHLSASRKFALRVQKDSVALVSTSTGQLLATVVDPTELDDPDGWQFESIDWSRQESICLIRGRTGARQRYETLAIFVADTSKVPVQRFEQLDLWAAFQVQLQKDRDRDTSLSFSLRNARVTDEGILLAEFRPVGSGSGQWDNDPQLDHYEAEFEVNSVKIVLRQLWRIRKTLINIR